MKAQSGQFLFSWFLTFSALGCIIIAFNVVVDPYHVFDMPLVRGFNAHKGTGANQVWLTKAFEAKRTKAKTVLLGSSRVEVGLDAFSSAWPKEDRPVYNLGIAAATPYSQFRYLQEWMANSSPETVVIGVDFEFFLNMIEAQHKTAGDFESRLAVKSDGSPNLGADYHQILDFTQIALSYDALADSVGTLAKNLEGDPSDTAGGNYPEEEFIEERRRTTAFALMEWYDVINVRRYYGGFNRFAMSDLGDILDLCELHGTRAIVYIHPMPADSLEVIDLLGYWPVFEEWKRELLKLVSQYPHRKTASGVELWDFSDFDAFSTESVRPDRLDLQWFWESWHYRRALGDLIIKRLFDKSDVSFGAALTEANMESHLAAIRARKREYRVNHKADFDRVSALFNSAMQVLRSPEMRARTLVID